MFFFVFTWSSSLYQRQITSNIYIFFCQSEWKKKDEIEMLSRHQNCKWASSLQWISCKWNKNICTLKMVSLLRWWNTGRNNGATQKNSWFDRVESFFLFFYVRPNGILICWSRNYVVLLQAYFSISIFSFCSFECFNSFFFSHSLSEKIAKSFSSAKTLFRFLFLISIENIQRNMFCTNSTNSWLPLCDFHFSSIFRFVFLHSFDCCRANKSTESEANKLNDKQWNLNEEREKKLSEIFCFIIPIWSFGR